MGEGLKDKLESVLQGERYKDETERGKIYAGLYSAMEKKLVKRNLSSEQRATALENLKRVIIEVEQTHQSLNKASIYYGKPEIDKTLQSTPEAPRSKRVLAALALTVVLATFVFALLISNLLESSNEQENSAASDTEIIEYRLALSDRLTQENFLTTQRGMASLEQRNSALVIFLKSLADGPPELIRPILLNLGPSLRISPELTGLVVISGEFSSQTDDEVTVTAGCFIDKTFTCKNAQFRVGKKQTTQSFSFELPDKEVSRKDFYLSWNTAFTENPISDAYYPEVMIQNLSVIIY